MIKKKRKIFFVVATGGHETDRHYYNTIRKKRTIREVEKFLPKKEIDELRNRLHDQNYIVWGAVPGSGNIRNWNVMDPGDYVMIYRKGKIILAAEVAMKIRNPSLAKYFWGKDKKGNTWEYIYFLINEIEVNVNQSKFNKYLGYEINYSPRGFIAIHQEKANKILSSYGDLISLLQKLEKGEELEEIDFKKIREFEEKIEEKIEKAPTEHTEMQWRLIRLGKKANLDVWVPEADQNKKYKNERFKELVISDFNEAIDVPSYIKNIDTVWKLGLSVKSAFEIEHSTQIYSGLLRLSDLRALAPNSNYPLFIVAQREKRDRVFKQLRRPTFSNEYINLDNILRFLSYDSIRQLDNELKDSQEGFDIDWLIKRGKTCVC